MRRRRAATAAATAGVLGFVCVAFLLAVDSQTGGHSQYRRALRAVDRARRDLSINLGNGACLWTPAEPLPATDDVPRTLLASYPGSGKVSETVFRIMLIRVHYYTVSSSPLLSPSPLPVFKSGSPGASSRG